MRLIDADVLKQECLYIEDIPTVTDYDIDNSPTIDAIPVEWIQAQVDNEKRAPLFRRYADALLTIWKYEQEV